MADGVEYDVQAAGDDATVLQLSIHCVRFARASDSISKEERVLAMEQVINQRQCDSVENLLLRDCFIKQASECVLGGLQQT